MKFYLLTYLLTDNTLKTDGLFSWHHATQWSCKHNNISLLTLIPSEAVDTKHYFIQLHTSPELTLLSAAASSAVNN